MKKTLLIMMLPLLLISCGNVKKRLGLERSQPDEFAVVERAPLTMPPNFNLTPPQPGAQRPQEANPANTAQGLVLGTGTGSTTTTAPADSGASAMPAVPTEPVTSATLDKTADSDLLSDAKISASQPVSNSAAKSSVLKPNAESQRLQQQHINTTISPVMKSPR